MAQEPDLSLRQQPLLRYWLATRPAFLAASVVPAVVGAAAAWAQGYALHGWLLAWTVLAVNPQILAFLIRAFGNH